MKRKTKSLVVTGCFLAVLMALIGAGLAPANRGGEQLPAASDTDHHVSDAQFMQYLEYRARLENSSNCQ